MNKLVITDTDYFFAIDNHIRDTWNGWAGFEADILLPVTEELLAIHPVKMEDYPTEGYYWKSDALKKYFNNVRNLQSNESIAMLPDEQLNKITNNEKFRALKFVTDNLVFGLEQAPPSSLFTKLLPRRRDILSACLASFPMDVTRPWHMDEILKKIPKFTYGAPNLVELGYLTGNVLCLTAAAETNILYREMVGCSGFAGFRGPDVIIWEVNPAVETMGKELIRNYNIMMQVVLKKLEMKPAKNYTLVVPTPDNITAFECHPELPRVAHLGWVESIPPDPLMYYFWVANLVGEVKDFYSNLLITTAQISPQSQSYTEHVAQATNSTIMGSDLIFPGV